jgi:hypothetical protein
MSEMSGPILQALDEQFPEVRWGASEADVQTAFPGGRVDPGRSYAVEYRLLGYPYPVVLIFTFDRGLSAVTVEYPRSFDLATGDMELPGRMVAESIYRHLTALLIIAFGGAPRPMAEPIPAERGDQVLADHTWSTRESAVRIEFRLQSGLGRVHVEMKAARRS